MSWHVSGVPGELREVRPDALAGGGVKEAVAAGAGVGIVEHDPPPGEHDPSAWPPKRGPAQNVRTYF